MTVVQSLIDSGLVVENPDFIPTIGDPHPKVRMGDLLVALHTADPGYQDPWPSSYAGRQTNLPVTGMQPPRGLRVDLQLAVAEDEPGLSYKHYDREPIPRKGFDAFEDE